MLNKLSNLNFESKMNTKKKLIEDCLDDKKSFKEILIHQLIIAQSELEDLKIDLDYFTKCHDDFEKKRYDQNPEMVNPKAKFNRKMTKNEEDEINIAFIHRVHVKNKLLIFRMQEKEIQ